jgi:hypothetical protein
MKELPFTFSYPKQSSIPALPVPLTIPAEEKTECHFLFSLSLVDPWIAVSLLPRELLSFSTPPVFYHQYYTLSFLHQAMMRISPCSDLA